MLKKSIWVLFLMLIYCLLAISDLYADQDYSDYEVIIIGAGAGGLSAGATLSQAGVKTLVLEQHNKPGGYMTAFERGDFRFEVSLHMMDGLDPGGETWHLFKKLGILHKVKPIKLDPLYRTIYPELTIDIPGNKTAYLDIFKEGFPEDADGARRLFKAWKKIDGEIIKLWRIQEKPFLYQMLQAPIFPFLYPNIARNFYKTTEEMTDSYVSDPGAKALILQMAGFLGTPPASAGALAYGVMWNRFYSYGAYHFVGGSQAVSNALADVIKENEGEVRLNTRVEKILLKNKKAVGVRTQSGEEIFADYIISNADARQTYLELVGEENLKPRYIKYIDGLEHGKSSIQVYLGLDQDLKKTHLAEVTELFYNDNSIYDFNGKWEDISPQQGVGGMGIAIYSNIDPTCAPTGKSVVVLIGLASYDWENRWRIDEGEEAYKKLKNAVADGMIDSAEKIIPGLRESIEEIEIATPLTMERYTSNYKGTWIGWALTPGQLGPRRMKRKGPIDHLYLAGAWTGPSGGQSTCLMSGHWTAKKIIKKLH